MPEQGQIPEPDRSQKSHQLMAGAFQSVAPEQQSGFRATTESVVEFSGEMGEENALRGKALATFPLGNPTNPAAFPPSDSRSHEDLTLSNPRGFRTKLRMLAYD